MKNKTKTIILTAAFAVFICAAVFAYNILREKVSPQMAQSAARSGEAEQMKAPDFTVLDNDGNETKLSDLFGKPVVLNFWASWCPPCKAEMPEFDKVYNEMGDEVTFMMVDLVDGQRETTEKGQAYISEQGFSFPVYYDVTGEAGYIYAISSIPTTIFIDKDGYVVTAAQGAINEQTLLKGIGMIREE